MGDLVKACVCIYYKFTNFVILIKFEGQDKNHAIVFISKSSPQTYYENYKKTIMYVSFIKSDYLYLCYFSCII